MKVKRIEHVGIVVRDVEASRKLWEGCFGIRLGDVEENATLNHICLEVENIDEALAELKVKGIPLLDAVPRIGHAGCRIAFLDPSATENCLIELAELPAGGAHHA